MSDKKLRCMNKMLPKHWTTSHRWCSVTSASRLHEWTLLKNKIAASIDTLNYVMICLWAAQLFELFSRHNMHSRLTQSHTWKICLKILLTFARRNGGQLCPVPCQGTCCVLWRWPSGTWACSAWIPRIHLRSPRTSMVSLQGAITQGPLVWYWQYLWTGLLKRWMMSSNTGKFMSEEA